jgi:hypothetical protein
MRTNLLSWLSPSEIGATCTDRRTPKCTLSCAAQARHTKCDFNVRFEKMKKAILILALLTALAPKVSLSSPSVADGLAPKIDGHRWGMWIVVDTTSHDPYVLENTRWMSSGRPDEEPTTFRSYLVLGLGPFFAIYISWGTLAIALAVTVVLVSIRLRRKRRKRTEHQNPELSPAAVAPDEA